MLDKTNFWIPDSFICFWLNSELDNIMHFMGHFEIYLMS
jgi:hypothetical protein